MKNRQNFFIIEVNRGEVNMCNLLFVDDVKSC